MISSIRGGPEANIAIEAATRLGIPVLYTVGRTEHAVAEYAVGLMLAIARHIPLGSELVRSRVLTSGSAATAQRDVIWKLPDTSQAARARAALTGTELWVSCSGWSGWATSARR